MNKHTGKSIALGAVIAALYAGLTLAFLPIGFGAVQLRVSEALTVLPYYRKEAVPGLFVGCIVANLVGGNGIYDVVFGSIATLLAAYITSIVKKKALAPLPPVVLNGLIVGPMLHFVLKLPLWSTVLGVALGEAVSCYVLGSLLMAAIEKYGLFRENERR